MSLNSCAIYAVRELAAKALLPLITEKNLARTISSLISQLNQTHLSMNATHGILVQLTALVDQPVLRSVFTLSTIYILILSINKHMLIHSLV